MSAEPIHGGGVTLQRTLGDQLDRFDWISKTIHFPAQPKPVYASQRSYFFPWWQHEHWLRKFIGCSRAYRISMLPGIRKRFAKFVANKMLESEPRILDSQLLVCPQADITLMVLEQLQKKRRLNYATWMMDDHLVEWRDDKWCYPSGFEQRMAAHLRGAKSVFVISPAMQEFYKQRFQVESTVLCGPATTINTPNVQPLRGSLRLAYFGSLGRWQNDAIELLAPQLKNKRISLDIYSNNSSSTPEIIVKAGANLCDGVSPSEVAKLCKTYDGLVLPISFKSDLKNMSYFNIATKFSECLGAGVPTLVIGPPDAIMVKIAKKHSAAIIVDETGDESMEHAIDRLYDSAVRLQTVQSALKLVQKEYSHDVMRSRWQEKNNIFYGQTQVVC